MPIQFAKFKKILAGIISITTIIAVLVFLAFQIIFNGGISGIILNLKPEPNINSSTMIAKREAATTAINQSFDELEKILNYNDYETTTHDLCSRGHSSWKRSDGYAYRCSLRTTIFYGFNGDFRQEMLDFEEKIISIGWEPPSYASNNPMKEMLEEHYDNYETYQGTGSPLRVSRLPKPRYYNNIFSLELEFAQKETSSFHSFDYTQKVSGHTYDDIFNEENFQDASVIIPKIANTDQFVLVISIQQDYFRD